MAKAPDHIQFTVGVRGPSGPDLVASLRESITADRIRREQRDRDNLPCPKCGGDRLRSDFTGSGRCHVTKAEEARP